MLRRRFVSVDRTDADGTVTFADRDAVLAYVQPSWALFGEEPVVPELMEPLVVRRRPVIFVCEK